MQNTTLSLFAESPEASARADAIDALHHATAIYTNESVVDELLARIDWPNGDASICDCSAGDGQFLTRAICKLLGAGQVDDEKLPSLVHGFELHPHAAAQARARVAAALISFGRPSAVARDIAAKIVRNQDFLTEGPDEPFFDFLVGNPPYLRMVNVPALLRAEYGQVVPKYAQLDLAHSFLDKCSKVLRKGGQMGFVVSDRWLINTGAAVLREQLGTRLAIEHIERVDSSTAFFRPKQRSAGTPARVHPVIVVFGPNGRAITKEAIYPGVDAARYAGYPTLDTIATVRIAPWLGSKGVFILTKAEAEASGIPREYLIPAVDTDDVAGTELREPRRFAIRTVPDVRPCEAVMEHLRRQMPRMAQRGLQSKMWLPPERFHLMPLDKPSLLVPRIVKDLKAVRVPPNVLPVNHNLSIVSAGPASLELIERALTSDLAAAWMRDHAPRLEGGYFSVCTTLLRKLPVDLT
jgi:hypothetical protein